MFGSAFDSIPEPEEPMPLVLDSTALDERLSALDNAIAELNRAVIRLSRNVAALAAPRTRHVHRGPDGNITHIVEEPEDA